MATYTENGYTKLEAFRENGYVVLEPYAGEVDPQEWLGVEWVDWKSSGDTRFAPLASAYGDVECDGFWNHTPPKTDKDGVWIESQTAIAPTLTARAQEPGANVGRCRIIELQPNQYGECLYNLHRDDNNRLNPEGTGWIVRGFFNLTDDKDSMMVLREVKDDAATETRIALPAGAHDVTFVMPDSFKLPPLVDGHNQRLMPAFMRYWGIADAGSVLRIEIPALQTRFSVMSVSM